MILAANGKKYGELDVNVGDSLMNQELATMASRIYDSFCRMEGIPYLEMCGAQIGAKRPLFELKLVGTASRDLEEHMSVTVSDSVCGQLFETVYRQELTLKHMAIDESTLSERLKANVIMYGEFKQTEECSEESWQPSPLAKDAIAIVTYHYRDFLSKCYPAWEVCTTSGPKVTATAIKKIE